MIRKGILLFLVAFQLTSGEFLKIPKKRQWGQLDQLKQLDHHLNKGGSSGDLPEGKGSIEYYTEVSQLSSFHSDPHCNHRRFHTHRTTLVPGLPGSRMALA